ncbi:MAG: glycerol-3-phosphate responsive antiterminator [Clostridia bacterium]|nr:glycerol-3-phosphate responsive antiterminator [Clostridia bacterium]
MDLSDMYESLERCPVIPAVREALFDEALASPAELIFLLEGDVMSVGERIRQAHANDKAVFIHIDLMKGIGKDRCGVEFLAKLGADGIISTRAALIKNAKELGLLAIQRYFAVDSQGLYSIREMIAAAKPDLIELMPGVIQKVISKFASEKIPVIAGGLIETKSEVTLALGSGANAVSTGKKDLWDL